MYRPSRRQAPTHFTQLHQVSSQAPINASNRKRSPQPNRLPSGCALVRPLAPFGNELAQLQLADLLNDAALNLCFHRLERC
jgi:hypothetical protein